jgi:TP901-1 family phage major tail protein
MALTLPVNPNQSAATVGKDYLIFVNTGTAAIPVWMIVGGQRSASLGLTADQIDVSNKTSGGWKETMPGLQSWSIDLDGLMLLNDNGVSVLRQAFIQRTEVNIKFLYPDGSYQVGWGWITDFSAEAPHDGEGTLSGTINGNGPLSNIAETFVTASSSGLSFLFDSKAYATAVTLAGITVAGLNYVADAKGQITFTNAYLKTLAVGEYLFTVNLSIGGYALIAVIVSKSGNASGDDIMTNLIDE